MCTSIRYQTENGINFLARTMDFGFELHGQPMCVKWTLPLFFQKNL